MDQNKIIFTPFKDNPELFEKPPIPATKVIPEWFKSTPQKHLAIDINDSTPEVFKYDKTFKLCVPFTDLITTGYVVVLPCDLYVDEFQNQTRVYWKPASLDIVDKIEESTHKNYPIPTGFKPSVFRFKSNWQIKTPKGHSILIQHPFYRNELPFYTLSAIVDTDKHLNSILYPFVLKEGFQGIIPAGTPIAQILPFERKDWNSEIAPYSKESKWWGPAVNRYFERSYKRQFWSKKTYR